MEGLAAGLAGVAVAFRPKVTTDMPVDLDRIAKVGREEFYGREARKANARFNPSGLASPCLKKDVIERILLELLGEGVDGPLDPMLEAVMEVHGGPEEIPFALKRRLFDYRMQRTFDVGTAIHEMEQQKYFGPSAQVLGHWRCSNCHREETSSLMPHPTKPCRNVVAVRNGKGKVIREIPQGEGCVAVHGVPLHR